MKYIIPNILLLLSQLSSYSQTINQEKLREVGLFYIGDSVAKFKPYIKCLDAFRANAPYSDTSKCKVYRFESAQKEVYEIGNINFNSLIFFIDEKKTIESVLYMISNISTNPTSNENDLNEDYNSLVKYLTDLFETPGQKKKYVKSKFYVQNGLVWKSGGLDLILEKTSPTKRKGKKLSTLSIYLGPQAKPTN